MLGLGQYEEHRFQEFKAQKAHVVVNLMNGMTFEGTIHDFDNVTVTMDVKDEKCKKVRQTIYRHAMESFYTTSDIDTFSN